MEKTETARLTDLLLRTHDRCQGYLYTGLDGDGFFLGSETEDDFRLGLAEQTIAWLRLRKPEDRDLVSAFLETFHIRLSVPGVVDLRKVFSHATKKAFDPDAYVLKERKAGLFITEARTPVHYALPIESRFTEIRMRQAFRILMRVREDKAALSVPLDSALFKKARIIRQTVSAPGFSKRSLVLQKGRDIPLKAKTDPVLHLSREGERSWRIAGHLLDDDIDLMIMRPNLILT